jgi:hypothetical protein
MLGSRATLRYEPSHALAELEREGQENMDLLRKIVIGVCHLGACQVGDPNNTRALAINAFDNRLRRTPQFFALLTDQHKGFHKSVGPLGFSIQTAFRKGAGVNTPGPHLVSDRFDYASGNQVWWRNDLFNEAARDIDSIIAVVSRARNTFLVVDC